MGAVAERAADHVIVTDDNPRGEDADRIVADILRRHADPGAVPRSSATGAPPSRCASAVRAPGDVVLVAGKGHEDYQIVGAERRAVQRPACVVRELLGAAA